MSESKKVKGPKAYWPAWRYHESKPEGQVFQNAEDVPAGWVDHPAKIGQDDAAPVKAPAAPAASTRKTKAEKDEERRLALLAEARKKFGDIVPDTATIAELESSLNGNGA